MNAGDQILEAHIREFVTRELLFSPDGFPYADNASFLQEGIIDSLGVMELVAFVQQSFGVNVEQHEIKPENFDSVMRLAAFVRRKQGAVARNV